MQSFWLAAQEASARQRVGKIVVRLTSRISIALILVLGAFSGAGRYRTLLNPRWTNPLASSRGTDRRFANNKLGRPQVELGGSQDR